MLGLETERRLLNLLEEIRLGEISQEQKRQRLCEIYDFSTYSSFMRLDRDANEILSAKELLNFFRDNREYTISEEDCYNLIKYFDSDSDGLLTYQEFQQIVLPCENNNLRQNTIKRQSYRVGRFDYLSANIEYQLSNLMYSEIALMRRLQNLKEELSFRYDFSNYAAYRTIDRYNDGHININNLRVFYRNNNHYLSEQDALAIIRRIDTDGDAKVSYSEFVDFINYQIPERPRAYQNDRRNWSADKMNRNHDVSFEHSSPLRPHTQQRNRTSEKKPRNPVMFSASKSFHNDRTPVKKQLNASQLNFSDQKTTYSYGASPQTHSKSLQKSFYQTKVEDNTVLAFKDYINLEKDLENAKQAIALKPDFNVYDAFRIFDIRSLGSIDSLDLKQGLENIGIFATHQEVDLFIKRYDTDKNGKIRFSEFCNAVVPIDPYYATLVNRRTSNKVNTYYRDDCFNYSTKLEFKELMRTHLRVERVAESLRKDLNRDPYFDVYEAFKACDINDDGIVTQNEIRDLLMNRGIYVTELEAQTLMQKLDKDRDGRVSLTEFAEEMRPKQLAL